MADKALYTEEKPRSKSETKDCKLWHERVSVAKQCQKQWAQDSGAERFEKEYKGDYGIVFHGRNKKIPVPPVNEVFAYVQSDIATTYNRDPYISVNPEAGTVKGAALWEVLLNYWWRKLKTKEEIEYEIIDKDVVGYAWHKVGYDPVTGKIFSKWIRWKDVVWNAGSKRPPNDCQWMAHRIVRPLEDIKAAYPAAAKLEGSMNPDVDEETYKKASYKDDIKVGVLWEVWDARKKQVLLLAEGLEDRYLEPPKPWPEYLTEFPFLMYWDFAVPGTAQPMSAIAPWEPQILEEMVLVAQMVNHSKRWNRQAFVNQASFDENDLDKFERGDDGGIITVKGKVGNDDLRFADFGQFPPQFFQVVDLLNSIKRNINGQPEFVQGGVTKTNTRTIGELQLMQQGTRSRQDRKIDRLETHCENIARHMMAHLKGNFDFEEAVKITGDAPEKLIEALGPNFDPATGMVTFTADDIAGEYDVDVKSGSTLPLDKQTKMQVMEIIFTTIGPLLAQGTPPSPTLVALIKNMLDGYDIKDIQEAYAVELEQMAENQKKAEAAQGVEEQKTVAEAEKRHAQAEQVEAETAIIAQDALIGPFGRAHMKKMEKPDPKPALNGAKK